MRWPSDRLIAVYGLLIGVLSMEGALLATYGLQGQPTWFLVALAALAVWALSVAFNFESVIGAIRLSLFIALVMLVQRFGEWP